MNSPSTLVLLFISTWSLVSCLPLLFSSAQDNLSLTSDLVSLQVSTQAATISTRRLLRPKRWLGGLRKVASFGGKVASIFSLDAWWTSNLLKGLGRQSDSFLFLLRSLMIFFGAAGISYFLVLRHYERNHRTRLHLPPQVCEVHLFSG